MISIKFLYIQIQSIQMNLKLIKKISRSQIQTILFSNNLQQRIQIMHNLEIDKSDSLAWNGRTWISPVKIDSAKQIETFVKNHIHHQPQFISLIHSLTHIEFSASLNYFDTYFRFLLPQQFKILYFQTAKEELSHFILLYNVLQKNNYTYGSIPVLNRLQIGCQLTKDCLLERIVVNGLIQEGRGLDSVDKIISKLNFMKQLEAVQVMKKIRDDQVKHVKIAVNLYNYLCKEKNIDQEKKYKEICQKFKIKITGKINQRLRKQAGFPINWLINQ